MTKSWSCEYSLVIADVLDSFRISGTIAELSQNLNALHYAPLTAPVTR